MKLIIEDWLQKQNFNRSVQGLFIESVKCYRADAFRAAFVFSYIGFLTELKFRILSANKPDAIIDSMWDKLQGDLKNENKWEEALLNQISNKTHQVFILGEDIIGQVFYWKNRRNDCVHFKNELVDNSLVESFWSFLQVFLPRFVVNGSKDSLLSKFRDHLDVSKTVPGKDFNYLIDQIHLSVESRYYESFFTDLIKINKITLIPIINKCLSDSHADVIEALERFLIEDKPENKAILSKLIISNPQHLLLIKENPERIRKLWYSKLFIGNNDDFPIFAFLLRNNMIPEAEKSQAITHVIDTIIKERYSFMPQGHAHEELKRHGFYDRFIDKMFFNIKIDHVSWYNLYDTLIKNLISKLEINERIVIILNDVFSKSYSPWALQNRLHELFLENPSIQDNIISIADQKKIKLCTFLANKFNKV